MPRLNQFLTNDGLGSSVQDLVCDGFPGRTRGLDLLTILPPQLTPFTTLSQSTPVPYIRFPGSTLKTRSGQTCAHVVLSSACSLTLLSPCFR